MAGGGSELRRRRSGLALRRHRHALPAAPIAGLEPVRPATWLSKFDWRRMARPASPRQTFERMPAAQARRHRCPASSRRTRACAAAPATATYRHRPSASARLRIAQRPVRRIGGGRLVTRGAALAALGRNGCADAAGGLQAHPHGGFDATRRGSALCLDGTGTAARRQVPVRALPPAASPSFRPVARAPVRGRRAFRQSAAIDRRATPTAMMIRPPVAAVMPAPISVFPKLNSLIGMPNADHPDAHHDGESTDAHTTKPTCPCDLLAFRTIANYADNPLCTMANSRFFAFIAATVAQNSRRLIASVLQGGRFLDRAGSCARHSCTAHKPLPLACASA